jgi:hypothetical protein
MRCSGRATAPNGGSPLISVFDGPNANGRREGDRGGLPEAEGLRCLTYLMDCPRCGIRDAPGGLDEEGELDPPATPGPGWRCSSLDSRSLCSSCCASRSSARSSASHRRRTRSSSWSWGSCSTSAGSRAQRDEAQFRRRLFSSQSEFPCRERARALDPPRSHHKDVARVRGAEGPSNKRMS